MRRGLMSQLARSLGSAAQGRREDAIVFRCMQAFLVCACAKDSCHKRESVWESVRESVWEFVREFVLGFVLEFVFC